MMEGEEDKTSVKTFGISSKTQDGTLFFLILIWTLL